MDGVSCLTRGSRQAVRQWQLRRLYTVVEAVDKNFLARHFGQDNGYLYGYDWPLDGSSYFFDYKGPDPALYTPRLFHPETHEIDPNPGPLVDFIRAVNETPDRDFLRVVGQYLDLPRFMKYVAVENFLAETDGIVGTYVGMNNFYLYQFENSTRFTFIPWDKSEAFTGGPEYPIWHYVDDVPTWMRNRLVDRAVRFSELRRVYLDTLIECTRLTAGPALAGESAGRRPVWRMARGGDRPGVSADSRGRARRHRQAVFKRGIRHRHSAPAGIRAHAQRVRQA